ncbi:eIF2A-related protein [Scytonema sp. PCC 10023]|uniref:nSTAND1 domain-containing NTPase n=1 Tax=Scytonema sp. PCC 10023 TaxID=1680591 RepID=UPI0039C67826
MSRDALVVGINTYNLASMNLNAPAEDAEAIAQRLEQYGEFKVTRLPAVKDMENNTPRVGKKSPVNLNVLEKAIALLFMPKSRQIPDTALLYFSGHGLRKDMGIVEGFLATSNVNPEDGKYGLPLRWLRQVLQESEVRQQMIILDCCYSGEILNLDEADPGERGKGRDRCFIAASRAHEVAQEGIGSKYSVLTNVLLEGLEPKQDRWVTNAALINFISQQENSFPQSPVYSYSGEPINLTRRRTLNTLDSTAKSEQAICPYKGLAYFDCTEEDAKYFYGRTALTDQLLEKVRTSNFLAVLGASGSGKSSVVRAGLLYQLKLGQRLSSSNNWQIRILKPGEQPLQSLALAFTDPGLSYIDGYAQVEKIKQLIAANGAVALENLIKDADTEKVVLVVDQFEEAFTLCQDIKERQQFFECLLGAVRKISNKLCLVLTMRSDFFGKCTEQEYSGLAQEIQQSLVTVTPMTEEELRQVVVQPATQVNLEIESELVEQILKDVKNAPGYLPLLEYTLTEMWKQRTDNCLRLNNYVKLGGVTGTLRQRATEVYESFSDETQKSAVRHIFVSLTQLGEGTEDTRRRVCQQDLVNKKYSEELINQVVQRLADKKLIVTEIAEKSGKSGRVAVVDIAHEALIRHWPVLREWVDKSRDALKTQRKIQAATEEWEKEGKSTDYLFKGLQLAQAKKLIEDDINTEELSSLALEFIQASQQEHERQKREELKQTISAFTQASEASLLANKQLEALINGVQAVKRLQNASLTEETFLRQTALVALQQAVYQVKECNRLMGHDSYVPTVSFSPDGKIIASGSNDKTIKLWSQDGKLLKTLEGDSDIISSIIFSPDGSKIASASDVIKLWSSDGELLNTFKKLTTHIWSISFSPDGSIIASGSEDGTVKLWSTDGSLIQNLEHNNTDPVISVTFSPDGKTLAFANIKNSVILWSIDDQLSHSTIDGWYVTFSPDGSKIASADKNNKTVILWSSDSQRLKILRGHTSLISSISFSPDSETIAAGSEDGTVKLWSTNGQLLTTLSGHSSTVDSVSFSPDGNKIASASWDTTIKLWSLKTSEPKTLKHSSGQRFKITSVNFNPNNSNIIAYASQGGTIKIWTRDGQLLNTLPGHSGQVNSVCFSPKDSNIIASAGNDNLVKIWNLMNDQLLNTLPGHSVCFSPDGETIASASHDNTIKLWRLNGQLLNTLTRHKANVTSVSFSPDGETIASASHDNTIKLWRLNGQLLNTLTRHKAVVTSVSFSPDGKTIASASEDSTVNIWSSDGQLLHTLPHGSCVTSVSFSPDSKTIASATLGTGIKLWSLDGQLIKRLTEYTTGHVYCLSFSPDSKTLASANYDGTVTLWTFDLDNLLVYSCDYLHDYLKNPNNDLTQENPLRQICDGIIY